MRWRPLTLCRCDRNIADCHSFVQLPTLSPQASISSLSTLRRAPVCSMGTATRDQELRRLVAFDPCNDRHGPLDYNAKTPYVLPRSPVTAFGRAPREQTSKLTTPGPNLVGSLCERPCLSQLERAAWVE